jgi:ligand-binding sensor domain-containing protein/signal transduction histidine kinase
MRRPQSASYKKFRLPGYLLVCLLGVFGFALALVHAERLPIRVYTSADGLGSSAAFGLVRDARGFIWICSRDGLIRFDGYRFITYRIGNDDADPAVYSLLPTRRGDYWINLNRGTDYRFVPKGDATLLQPIQQSSAKSDPRIPLSAEPIANYPLPDFEDNAGNLWTFDGKGIYQLREEAGRLASQFIELKLPGNPGNGLGRAVFHQGRDGSLWIGTHWGLVRRLPDGKLLHFTLRPENNRDPVYFLAEDQAGRIWMARPEGLLVLKVEPLAQLSGLGDLTSRKIVTKPGRVNADGQTQLPEQIGEAVAFTFADILHPVAGKDANEEAVKPVTFGLLCAADGKLWAASNRGLILFDGKRFQHFTSQQGLGPSGISSMVEDNEGHLWLLSYAGLLRLNPNGLTSFDQTDGLPLARVHAIYEDRNSELNVVTGNWNIGRLHNGVFQTARPRLPAEASWTWHSNLAFLDSRGDWWLTTNQKLYRYSGLSRLEELGARNPTAVYDTTTGLLNDNTYRIYEDSRGDIWIATTLGANPMGLTRWQRATGKFQHFLVADGLPDPPVASAFAEDRAGNLWFGFTEGGLARYSAGRFTTLTQEDGIPPGMITSLYTDRAGRLWIASGRGGLSRMDDPTAARPRFKHYTIADGLTSNNVRCITEDLLGNIYIGTVRGVNRLTPETGLVKYYGIADGLAADFVNVAYRDRQGALWFGTFNGLSKLVPAPDQVAPPPPILISGLRIAGVDYAVSPLGQTEVLVPAQGAERNNLQIDFFSIGSGGAAATRYQYKLVGGAADWSPLSAERSVTFANLSPGAYRFLVRAVNADNVASQQPASVSFTILRPLWQRWWFLALLAGLAGLAIYSLYHYRVAQLLKLERVRTRIATDLHDDIGASLSRMAILSEVVKQADGHNPQSSAMLTEIADSARGLVDSMSDIVWSIDPRRDDLQQVLARARQFAADVFEAQGVNWQFKAPAELAQIKLDPDTRRHLFLILKETINNAAKYAECTNFSIELSLTSHRLLAEIRDDGKGFIWQPLGEGPPVLSKSRGGNGLRNLQARAAEIGGALQIDSTPGQGTHLRLTIPLKK